MLDPGLLDPDHVIEQQLLAVLGGEPGHLQPGAVNHHPAQGARLGMNAVFQGHEVSYPATTARLSAAMMMIVKASSSGQTKRNQRS